MSNRRAFTRIEAIAAMTAVAGAALVSLPMVEAQGQLSRQAASVPARMRTLSQGLAIWAASDNGQLPLAYVYGASATGGAWNAGDQGVSPPNPANGYVHWSWGLINAGLAAEEAFSSPDALRGGAPRANPGPEPADWEPGQLNTIGAAASAALPLDRQAARVAFAPNGALMPRNHLNGSTARLAQRVGVPTVNNPGRTILLAQMLWTPINGWRSFSDGSEVIKSFRPLVPFTGISAGRDIYTEPNSGSSAVARFTYPTTHELLQAAQLPQASFDFSGTELNLVHRSGASDAGLYAFLDGHVGKHSLAATVTERLWGDRFYSITGNNLVRP